MNNLFKEWEDRWKNLFPRNPTQTAYLRFLKTPEAGVKSRFTESQRELSEFLDRPVGKDWTKTSYLPDGLKEWGERP